MAYIEYYASIQNLVGRNPNEEGLGLALKVQTRLSLALNYAL
jgi:hypothetical protein